MKLIVSILLFLLSGSLYSQHIIELYVYSNYRGPIIDFTAETSGVSKEFYGFSLTGWMVKKDFRAYSDFNSNRYSLNCDKLRKGYKRGDFGKSHHYSGKKFIRLERIEIKKNHPFTLKYDAQENGPSKGTWTGVVHSKSENFKKKCFLINLNQRTSSVTQYGRFIFYQINVACAGYTEVFINDNLIGRYYCYFNPEKPQTRILKAKGLCDILPLVYSKRNFLVSKQFEYGKYKIKEVFKATDGRIISKSVKEIILNEPCESLGQTH